MALHVCTATFTSLIISGGITSTLLYDHVVVMYIWLHIASRHAVFDLFYICMWLLICVHGYVVVLYSML